MVPSAVPSLLHNSTAPFSSPWINNVPLTLVMERGMKGRERVLNSELAESAAKPWLALSAMEAKLTGSVVAILPIPAEMKGAESVVEVKAPESNDCACPAISPGQEGLPEVSLTTS